MLLIKFTFFRGVSKRNLLLMFSILYLRMPFIFNNLH